MPKDRKKKKKNGNLIFFIGLGLASTIFGAALYYEYQERLDLKVREDALLMQIQQQEKIGKELENQSDYKESDLYIEKIAREQLNMVKPNEIVFVNINK